MPLDPRVQQLLDALAQSELPPVHEVSPEAARQQMRDASAALGKPEEVASIEDRVVPGSDGEIPVRLYRPAEGPLPQVVNFQGGGGYTVPYWRSVPTSRMPVVVYLHGGGWVVGSVDTHDGYCRALANAARAVVVSVDYRLAPEHTFPAAAEDAYAAAVWVSEHLDEIGRREPIIVAGDSAGGNLAAVVALMARDRGGPPIGLQVLIYPVTDHDFNTSSYTDFADGYFLSRDAMMWFWDHYCPGPAERNHAYAAPLRAENLTGLPPALVITAEFDPLRDEGEAYAKRLRMAGNDVVLTRYDGMIHGFTRRFHLLPAARASLEQIAATINRT